MILNQFAIISSEELAKLKTAGVTSQHFKDVIPFLCPQKWTAPFNKLNIMFFIDASGDFTSAKTRNAQIVRAMYNSLGAKDKTEVMAYLMESE